MRRFNGPRILVDRLDETRIPRSVLESMTIEEMLYEAEWALEVYSYMDPEDDGYTKRQYSMLKRWVDRKHEQGIKARAWEES